MKIDRIYANACEDGRKNFFDVPIKNQPNVRLLIESDGYMINEDGTVEPKPINEGEE